jgi:hypothetical protein
MKEFTAYDALSAEDRSIVIARLNGRQRNPLLGVIREGRALIIGAGCLLSL